MTLNPSTACAQQIVTSLVAAGVRHIVLAPGSRSAPLAYALAAADEAGWCQVHVSVDERSAAFIALGLSRQGPAALVTTSGTAVANLHPAVLEAGHGHLPLVLVTADRPHQLRGVGANQTTDQVKIFGSAMRQAWEIPAGPEAASMAGQIVHRAVIAATGRRSRHPGPVHLNVGFADPLTPDELWRPGAPPHPGAPVAGTRPAPPTELRRGPATVVVAGDGAGPPGPAGDAIREGVQRWGWPVLAEPSSGLRGSNWAVPAGHVLVRNRQLAESIERVVVLGRPTLQRSIAGLLARTDIPVLVVSQWADWTDVAGSAAQICDDVTVPGEPTPSEQQWWLRWQRAGRAAQQVLAAPADPSTPAGHSTPADHSTPAEPNEADRLTGPAVARELLSAPGEVMLGSSMAARHADLAGPVGAELAAVVHANRGLAGIDGTIATATGLALRGRPMRVLVGDLTFQHDATSLIRGTLEEEVDLQVVVLDDHGGSIFAMLEHGQEKYRGVFDRYFRTPQSLDMAAMARAAGAQYQQVHTVGELRAQLAQPVRGRSVVRIELADDGGASRLAAQVTSAVESVVAQELQHGG